ncbi:PAS domain S-box protein [bacterium]|nr:PAS domain S-box protein [bacterium]
MMDILNDRLERLKAGFAGLINDLNSQDVNRDTIDKLKDIWKKTRELYKGDTSDSLAGNEIKELKERTARAERAYNETRETLNELLSAQKLAAAFRATYDAASLCGLFIDTITPMIPIEEIGIYQVENAHFKKLYPAETSQKFEELVNLNWDEGLIHWVLNEARPIIVNAPDQPVIEAEKGCLIIPLIIAGESFGFILALVDRPPKDFKDTDFEIIFFLASQTALALEIARLLQSLTETRDFLASILENAHDLIIVCSGEGEIIFINRAIENYGYEQEQLLGQPVINLIADEETAEDLLNPPEKVKHKNIDLKGGGKEIFHTSATISRLEKPEGGIVGTLAVLKDISKQKRLESQLIEVERRAAIAQTVITINHEINNPLAIVMGHLYLVKNRAVEAGLDDIVEKLEAMDKNCRRIKKIAHKLQNLTKSDTTDYLEGIKMLDIKSGDKSIEIL